MSEIQEEGSKHGLSRNSSIDLGNKGVRGSRRGISVESR